MTIIQTSNKSLLCFRMLAAVVFLFLFAGQARAADVMDAPALKFRVYVKSGTDAIWTIKEKKHEKEPSSGLSSQSAKLEKGQKGAFLETVKSRLNESPFARTVENLSPGESQDSPDSMHVDFTLLAHLGSQETEKRVFLKLVNNASGVVESQSEASAPGMEEAVGLAVDKIDNTLSLKTWRCQVWDVSGTTMIIARGALDGLRQGQELDGYALDKNSHDNAARARDPELAIAAHAKAKGRYKVVQVGDNVAKIQTVSGSAVLAKHDLLEAPGVRLENWSKQTRGRGAWDKIFSKESDN